MRKIIVLLFVLLHSFAFGQLEEVRNWTKTLCSPDFHGRGYVSGGDSIAANYLAKEYQKIGLTPVPGQKSMLQPFQFPVNTFPGEMEVRLNENELTPGVDYIVDPSSGFFNGYVNSVFMTSKEVYDANSWNEFLFKYIGNTKRGVVTNIDDVKGDSLKVCKARLREWTENFTIIQLTSAKFTWSVSSEYSNYPYIIMRDSLWDDQKIEINIENQWLKNHTANNVLAYLPSKRKTNKTIFFTAHYDHLGRMGAETYFPGANDNASGSAVLLSLASYFKLKPSKYNLVFVSFAGEEAGLIGSHYYVNHPLLPLSEMKFLINLDIMGSGEDGITAVNATLFPKQFKKLQKINKKNNLLKTVNSRGPAANSDHYFFSEKGVPSFFIYTMGPNKNYHDVFDTYEALSFAEFTDLTELVKRFVKKL